MKTTSTLILTAIASLIMLSSSCKKDDSSSGAAPSVTSTPTGEYILFNSHKYAIIEDTVIVDTQGNEYILYALSHYNGDTLLNMLYFETVAPTEGNHSFDPQNNDAGLYFETNSQKGVAEAGACQVKKENGKYRFAFSDIAIRDQSGAINKFSADIKVK